MAKIKKKSQRQLKNPDEEIRSIVHTIADSYRAYRNQFNAVLTIAGIVVVVLIVYTLISANKEKQAGQLLDAAYQTVEPGGAAPYGRPDPLLVCY